MSSLVSGSRRLSGTAPTDDLSGAGDELEGAGAELFVELILEVGLVGDGDLSERAQALRPYVCRRVVLKPACLDGAEQPPTQVGFGCLAEFEGDDLAGVGFGQERAESFSDSGGVDHQAVGVPEVGQGCRFGGRGLPEMVPVHERRWTMLKVGIWFPGSMPPSPGLSWKGEGKGG